jgi:hypothetical protein
VDGIRLNKLFCGEKMTTKAEIREHFTKFCGTVDYIDSFTEEWLKTVEEDRTGIYYQFFEGDEKKIF